MANVGIELVSVAALQLLHGALACMITVFFADALDPFWNDKVRKVDHGLQGTGGVCENFDFLVTLVDKVSEQAIVFTFLKVAQNGNVEISISFSNFVVPQDIHGTTGIAGLGRGWAESE